MLAARAVRPISLPKQRLILYRQPKQPIVKHRTYSNEVNISQQKNNFLRINNSYYNLRYIKYIHLTTTEATICIANTETIGDLYDRCRDSGLSFQSNTQEYLDVIKYLGKLNNI